jgi:hypothetical protein
VPKPRAEFSAATYSVRTDLEEQEHHRRATVFSRFGQRRFSFIAVR